MKISHDLFFQGFLFLFLVILWSIYTNIKVLFIDWAFRAWVMRQLSEAPDRVAWRWQDCC